MIDINKQNSSFLIEGGHKTKGSITPQGNKNEALPLLAAALLSRKKVTLRNIPIIKDVEEMCEIMTHIGAKVTINKTETENVTNKKKKVLTRKKKNIIPEIAKEICIEVTQDLETRLPDDLCAKIRASVLLAGPLLAREGEVYLPRPGGDRIGRRRLDTHILAFKALGAKVTTHASGFHICAETLRGAEIHLDEASVTATENALCAASCANGPSVIYNAACEPHVQALCRFLQSMGAKIDGIGSNLLHIQPTDNPEEVNHLISPDYLEVGSLIALAAVTRGSLLIHDADVKNMRTVLGTFKRLGVRVEIEKDAIYVPSRQKMEILEDLGGAIPHIDDAPWPGLPADMTSVMLVLATQCKGTVLLHEKLFESRLFFTDRLLSMGAKIVLCDPHRAVIIGPARLRSIEMSSPDIRAGMALILAAACAKGTSKISNIHQIHRGFSHISERLNSIGLNIKEV